ncbi:MAG TPA: HNH endonuclease [Allosphingosinicella sp.]|nr:HNH endonuclease [Allosphingosinicella sp.]
MAAHREPLCCFLCGRPTGEKVQWHHVVPRSRGGREKAAVHPICHRTIHATLTNKELERSYSTGEALRAHPEIAKFLQWVSGKDPDFHAPTRRRKGS